MHERSPSLLVPPPMRAMVTASQRGLGLRLSALAPLPSAARRRRQSSLYYGGSGRRLLSPRRRRVNFVVVLYEA